MLHDTMVSRKNLSSSIQSTFNSPNSTSPSTATSVSGSNGSYQSTILEDDEVCTSSTSMHTLNKVSLSESNASTISTLPSLPPSTQVSMNTNSSTGFRLQVCPHEVCHNIPILPNSTRGGNPVWDVSHLAAEAKDLMHKAQNKVKKRKNLFVWCKKWIQQQISCTEKGSILTTFIPKVKDTLQDVNIWLQSIMERKVISNQQSTHIIHALNVLIVQYTNKINFYDEMLNDYCIQLQILSNIATNIRNVILFNEDIMLAKTVNKPLTHICEQSSVQFSPELEDVGPSKWTGYRPIDSVKVSSSAFKQAFRNYVPKSVTCNSSTSTRTNSSSSSSSTHVHPSYHHHHHTNSSKINGSPSSSSSSSAVVNSNSKCTYELIRDKSKAESDSDDEHRTSVCMAGDEEHLLLFAKLDAIKAVKKRVVTHLQLIEQNRELDKQDIRHLESIIHQITHLLHESPYSTENDNNISNFLEHFTIDSDGKLKSARLSLDLGLSSSMSNSSSSSKSDVKSVSMKKVLTPSSSSHNFLNLIKKESSTNSNTSSHSDLTNIGHPNTHSSMLSSSSPRRSTSSSKYNVLHDECMLRCLVERHPMVSNALNLVNDLKELSMEKKTAETNLTHLSDILETAKSLESQLLAPPITREMKKREN